MSEGMLFSTIDDLVCSLLLSLIVSTDATARQSYMIDSVIAVILGDRRRCTKAYVNKEFSQLSLCMYIAPTQSR